MFHKSEPGKIAAPAYWGIKNTFLNMVRSYTERALRGCDNKLTKIINIFFRVENLKNEGQFSNNRNAVGIAGVVCGYKGTDKIIPVEGGDRWWTHSTSNILTPHSP